MGQGRVWKVMALIALDRSKNPTLCKEIWNNPTTSFSMGAMVKEYRCSYCDQEAYIDEYKRYHGCNHINIRPGNPVDFYEISGQLIFRKVGQVRGYELSQVETPAYSLVYSGNVFGRASIV